MATYPPPPGGGGAAAPPPFASPSAPVPPPSKRYRASDSPATAAQQQQQQQATTTSTHATAPPAASPNVDDAIARRRAELRRLQALRARPTPRAPPRGSGADVLEQARSHLAERRRDTAPVRGGGGGGSRRPSLQRLEGTVGGAAERGGTLGIGNSGQLQQHGVLLVPGPPPPGVGRRSSSLYGRTLSDGTTTTSAAAAAAAATVAVNAPRTTSATTANAAIIAAAPSHHPPPVTRPPPPRPRSASAPPRRPPPPPPAGSSGSSTSSPFVVAAAAAAAAAPPPRGEDAHSASAGVAFAPSPRAAAAPAPPPALSAGRGEGGTGSSSTSSSSSRPNPGGTVPPTRVSFHTGNAGSSATPLASLPVGAAATTTTTSTSAASSRGGGGSVSTDGTSPPAARRLNLSPFEQKKKSGGGAADGSDDAPAPAPAPAPTTDPAAPPVGPPPIGGGGYGGGINGRAMPGHASAAQRRSAPPTGVTLATNAFTAAEAQLQPQPQPSPASSSKDIASAAAASSPAAAGPPPPVTTPIAASSPPPGSASFQPSNPFVTDTIRRADRVLQDDIPTPKQKITANAETSTRENGGGGGASTSVVSGLTSEMVSPPTWRVGGSGGIPPIPPMTDESNKSAQSRTSRKEVLTSMFLGADSPAPPRGGAVAAPFPAATATGAPPEDTRSAGADEAKPKKSAQLRLVKELRLTKETNVKALKDVAKLETEVATLRSKHGDLDRSSSGVPAMGGPARTDSDLEALVEIAAKDGEAEAIKWATGRLEQQKHSRSSTSLNSIGFSSPPGLPFSDMMSPLTSPRERIVSGGNATAVGTMTEGSNGGTPKIRRRIQTPHARRRDRYGGAVSSGGSEDAGLPDRDVLMKAAESIPHEFVSDLATYYVRVPYIPYQPDDAATPGSPDPWELHGVVASSRFYADVADANRASTIEVMARIVSDGSVAVLHDACSLRHETAGGNGSNDFQNVDSMDGPLGCVMYIDVDGTEREYWLDAIYEEAQATRDAYCSSLLSAASALKAAAPSMAAVAAAAPPMNHHHSPPAVMASSSFPAVAAPPPGAGSFASPQKSPTADACVGTEEIAFPPPAEKQTKLGQATTPDKKKSDGKVAPSPVEFDDGSGSTDALSMMLGFIFSTVFNITYFFLIGLPLRVVKYSVIFLVLYVTLTTVRLYLADDNGAMIMGALVDYGGSYQQSLW